MIDVLVITYNHAPYLPVALQSLADQQTNFPVRIILADDASTDGSGKIMDRFASRCPHPVIRLESEKNLGMLGNYNRAFKAASARYIAILEGDDFWTDPHRLQKHVDFMEARADVAMTMNRYEELLQESGTRLLPPWPWEGKVQYLGTADLAKGILLGNLSACVIRNSAWQQIREDIFDMPVADWMIGMALGEFGRIALLNDAMSVYRKIPTGGWSGLSEEAQKSAMLELIERYDAWLGYRYHDAFMEFRDRLHPRQTHLSGKGIRSRLQQIFLRSR